MTTLAELIELGKKAEKFGFTPDEVQVEFKSGANSIFLLDAKACVSATQDNAKPILTIVFSSPKTDWNYR